MPKGSVCCQGGGYCDAGEVCGLGGTCDKLSGGSGGGSSGSGGSSSGSSGSGSSGSSGSSVTCSAGKRRCDDEFCIPSDGSTCCNTGQGKFCEVSLHHTIGLPKNTVMLTRTSRLASTASRVGAARMARLAPMAAEARYSRTVTMTMTTTTRSTMVPAQRQLLEILETLLPVPRPSFKEAKTLEEPTQHRLG